MKKLAVLSVIIIYSCQSPIQKAKQMAREDSLYAETTKQVELEKEPNSIVDKFTLGQSIKLEDYIITLIQVSEHKSNDPDLNPPEGMRLFAINVEYENPSKDLQLNTNPMQWKLYDTEGYSYQAAQATINKEPKLPPDVLNPGGKIKGWITYEIRENAKPVKVKFQPSFLENENVEIDISK